MTKDIIKSILFFILGFLITIYLMTIGLFGAGYICKMCLSSMTDKGWFYLSENTFSLIFVFWGILLGFLPIGIICVVVLKLLKVKLGIKAYGEDKVK